MVAKRILIAEFKHETNTFSTEKTGMEKFLERYIKTGNEIINFFKNTKVEMGGFIDVLESEQVKIVPAIAANAWPGGPVTREVYELVKTKIYDSLRQTGKVDGILLSLHGAMVLGDSPDGEGDLLSAVRSIVGPDIPIMASLDLHANVTSKMASNVNGLFPFDNYPHTDMYERGLETAKNMMAVLKKQLSPVIRIKKLPLLSPLLETGKYPHKEFLLAAQRWEKDPRVISVSIATGFSYADIYDAGVTIIAQTNNEIELAEHICEQIGKAVMAKHRQFIKEVKGIEEAIAEGMSAEKGPVILADVADNPGAGSPGDGTHILRKLINMQAYNVGFALIPDQEVVEQAIHAGVGAKINVDLGGKSNPILGEPVKAAAMVKTITDGVFFNKGPMSHGLRNDLGRAVVLDIDGIEVIVTERRFQPWDAEIFRRFGIEPKDKQIIVLKSSLHYRASFGAFAKDMIDVDAPGLAAPNLNQFDYKHVRRPIFPLDEVEDYGGNL